MLWIIIIVIIGDMNKLYKYEPQINYQPASHNVHVVHCNSYYSFLFLNDTCIQKYYRRYSLSYSGVKGFEFDGNAFVLKWTWPKYETQLRRRMKKKRWSLYLSQVVHPAGANPDFLTGSEYHQEGVSLSPWMGCQSIARLPPSICPDLPRNLPVPFILS